MATPAHHPIHDQNLNLLYAGATPGGKTNNVSKPDKKGGLGGGRKALNDISNSRRPSAIQLTNKEKSTNAISIDKNPGEAKAKFSKVLEKGKTVGGRTRKALTDLTNSVKPSAQPTLSISKKFSSGENIASSLAEEGFLHDHQKCTRAQVKSMDIDYFLETVGLNNNGDTPALKLSSNEPESTMRCTKLDEVPEEESRPKNLNPHGSSPLCQSPKSPQPPYMNWDNLYFDVSVAKSPKTLLMQ